MKLSDYDYCLPPELIAQEPLQERDKCRLLVLGEKMEHKKFHQLINYLYEGDVLVINETKVLPAKFVGKKSTGGRVALVFEKEQSDCLYECRIKSTNMPVGSTLLFENLRGKVVGRDGEKFHVEFDRKITSSLLQQLGEMPLPPYVKKKLTNDNDYQTIYSCKEGSMAAPTAGFHFTADLLRRIEEKGVKIAKVCLHISFGTFSPIKEDVLQHNMEKEYFEIDEENAALINGCKGKLVAVGTTSLKTLESAADEEGNVKAGEGWTDLFITPSYKLKTKTSMMVTNFHLPKSTLLLLVSCFAGRERVLRAYQEAIEEKYRFYSFGDAMLLFNSQPQ